VVGDLLLGRGVPLGAPFAPAQLLQPHVHGHAIEPGRELGLTLEPLDRAEDLDEHILQRVLEVSVGAQDPVQGLGDVVSVLPVELGLRGAVLALATADQILELLLAGVRMCGQEVHSP